LINSWGKEGAGRWKRGVITRHLYINPKTQWEAVWSRKLIRTIPAHVIEDEFVGEGRKVGHSRQRSNRVVFLLWIEVKERVGAEDRFSSMIKKRENPTFIGKKP